MNKQKSLLLVTTLALIAGTAGVLAKYHPRMGAPGVRTSSIPDSNRLLVELPERVLDYQSPAAVEPPEETLTTLPQDTSFGERHYEASDGFRLVLSVVLMGCDRTSLHKPQFCLEGQGFRIDGDGTLQTAVQVDRPVAYELPIVRLLATKENSKRRMVYVYWYVADGALSATAAGGERMWWMARDLLRTGVLQRWAYVICYSECEPGQEEKVFERLKKFIAAAAPEFQLTPRPKGLAANAK